MALKSISDKYTPPRETSVDRHIKEVSNLGFDEKFLAFCVESGVDTEGYDTPEYWNAVAEFKINELHGKPELNPDEKLALVLFATPDAVIRQQRKNTITLNKADLVDEKEMLSYYGSLLKDVASTYLCGPIELERAIQDIAARTVIGEFDGLSASAVEKMSENFVRGALHEHALAQIAERAGYGVRSSTPEEDVTEYTDLFLTDERGYEMRVDVKASTSEVEKIAYEEKLPYDRQRFYTKRDNIFVMWSLVTDKEMRNSFRVPEHILDQRAELLRSTLG